jgi:hypothetical protein
MQREWKMLSSWLCGPSSDCSCLLPKRFTERKTHNEDFLVGRKTGIQDAVILIAQSARASAAAVRRTITSAAAILQNLQTHNSPMFQWATLSDLKELRGQYGEAVDFDDWLDGWAAAAVRRAVESSGLRPTRDSFCALSTSILSEPFRVIWQASIPGIVQSAPHGAKFDAVVVVDNKDEDCFRPVDIENPFAFLERLNQAAALVQFGGYLIWTQFLRFAEDSLDLQSPLEPAALYQNLVYRGFRPLKGDWQGAGRIAIYNHPDTIFLGHSATLAYCSAHRRVTRVICALRRPEISQR